MPRLPPNTFRNLRSSLHKKSSDEWYSPLEMIRALGRFDLDPACGPLCPNRTARRRFGPIENGLCQNWKGRVWCNPPFSNVVPWVDRMIAHNNGCLLVFSRSDAVWFQRAAVAARGVFFLKGRTQFSRPEKQTRSHCPLGCVLFGFGEPNRRAIREAEFPGIWLGCE